MTTMMTCSTRCPGCERALPADAFHVDRRRPSGLTVYCRDCRRERDARRKRDRSHEAELARRRRSDPARRRAENAAARGRRIGNERYREQQARWRARNREHLNKYARAWRRRNAAHVRAYAAAYRNGHRDDVRRWARQRRERVADATLFRIDAARLAARWDYYGGRCWMCRAEANEWDHVIPVALGGLHVPANLRPACRSCNRRKAARWPADL